MFCSAAQNVLAPQLRKLENFLSDFQLVRLVGNPPLEPRARVTDFKIDFEISKRAVSGMVFAKILEQIHKGQVSEGGENAIRVLAIEHGGHWKKLESLLVRASKNSRTLR